MSETRAPLRMPLEPCQVREGARSAHRRGYVFREPAQSGTPRAVAQGKQPPHPSGELGYEIRASGLSFTGWFFSPLPDLKWQNRPCKN